MENNPKRHEASDLPKLISGYSVLDTPPDEKFDRITRMAVHLFNVPVALVAIEGSDYIWLKAHHGISFEKVEPGTDLYDILHKVSTTRALESLPPETSFSSGEDTFYLVGFARLPVPSLYNMGAVCIFDTQPRQLSPEDQLLLKDLAALTLTEIEHHQATNLIRSVRFDMNNCLTATLGYVDLLLMETAESDPKRESLEMIKKATMRCWYIMQMLYAFDGRNNLFRK